MQINDIEGFERHGVRYVPEPCCYNNVHGAIWARWTHEGRAWIYDGKLFAPVAASEDDVIALFDDFDNNGCN